MWRKAVNIFFFLAVYVCRAQVITTIAGNGVAGYSGDGGLATNAQLKPVDVAIDKTGNLFISDGFSHTIRKVDPNGIISTIAGTGSAGYSGDSGLAVMAQLNTPWGICLDTAGNLYVAEAGNHIVRLISKQGTIYTVAGNGSQGFSGDNGPALSAQLNTPLSVVYREGFGLYIAEEKNYVIRKVDLNGIITRVAGSGLMGGSGDGGMADTARLFNPGGIDLDDTGNLYISDACTHRIRKVGLNNIISTVAGNGSGTPLCIGNYGGNGGPAINAMLRQPRSVAIDKFGNLYISDNNNHVVRAVDQAGIINNAVGTAVAGYSGDNGPPLSAQLKFPSGIVFDTLGNLYIADLGNNVVRKVSFQPGVAGLKLSNSVQIWPNPASDHLNIDLADQVDLRHVRILDLLGNELISQSPGEKTIDISALSNGVYLVHVQTLQGVYTKKVVVQH